MHIVSVQLRLVEHRASLARRPWSPVWCVRVEEETILFHKFPKPTKINTVRAETDLLCSPDGEARFESVRQSVPPHAVGVEVPQVVMTPLDAEIDQRSQSLAWMARWNLNQFYFWRVRATKPFIVNRKYSRIPKILLITWSRDATHEKKTHFTILLSKEVSSCALSISQRRRTFRSPSFFLLA